MVRVSNIFYSVVPESSKPGQAGDKVGGRGTVTQCISKMGLLQTDHFGPNHERIGIEVIMSICSAYDSAEHYVKMNYLTMKVDLRPGMRVQYRELIDSALTIDLLIQKYAEAGRSQDDLKMNNIFEIHMTKIALHDYKNRTNNFVGAEFVSGRGRDGEQVCCRRRWRRRLPTSRIR